MLSKKEAWDYALGICKVGGGKPSDELLEFIEKEICGEITHEDIRSALIKKYTLKEVSEDA